MVPQREQTTGGSFPKGNHESRGDYMSYKVQKLHQSQANSYGPPLSSIFASCAIFVNGLTTPPRNEIQRLVSLHGGAFHSYQTSTTTHFICDIFPNAKLKLLRKSSQKKVFYVTASWLLDSIEKGQRLPEAGFLPQGLLRQHGGSMVRYFSVSSVQDKQEEEEMEQEEERDPWIVNDPPPLLSTSSLPPRLQSEIKHPLRCSVSLPSKPPIPFLISTPAPALFSPPAPYLPTTDQRGAATDPNFINNYFETSRLHFLGSWKARLPALRSSIQRERESRTESTQLSLPFPIDRPLGEAEDRTSRTVIHIDMDCFFVSVLLRDRGEEFAKIPVAVAHSKSGSSDVSSCNYPARAKGLRNGMFMSKAKELCPELVVMHYDFQQYESVSEQIYRIFFTVADILQLPTERVIVQPVSVDEAYLEIISVGNRQIDGLAVAALIRQRIWDDTRCPSSAGVGDNMLLARLATKKAKPNGQYQVSCSLGCDEFMRNVSLGDIPGVGWKIGKKLSEKGYRVCSELWPVARPLLIEWFGQAMGSQLYGWCRGQDSRELTPFVERKSIGAEVNWGLRFTSSVEVETFLNQLSHEVHERMERAEVAGKTLTLKVKKRKAHVPHATVKFLGHGDCDNVSKSLSSQSPFLDPSLLATKVVSLFNSLPVSIPPEDVRGIGIHITKLAHHDYLQTPKAVPTRQLFPLSTVPRPPRQDPERQRSETRQNSSSSGGYVVPSLSQIDREVLTQLPEDVKHEIKRSLPPRLPPPPKPGKRTRTLVTCFEANAGSISKRSLTRGVDGTGRPFTPQRANRVAAPPVKEGEVRSPFSLTQQTDFLVSMPAELVEEVWEEMCAEYRTKKCRDCLRPHNVASPAELSKRKLNASVPLELSPSTAGTKSMAAAAVVSQGWEQRSVSVQELETLLSGWKWGEDCIDQLNSLLTHAEWLLSRNRLDRVSSLLKTIRRLQKYATTTSDGQGWSLAEETLLQALHTFSMERYGCSVSWL